jgi:hypothetical protein
VRAFENNPGAGECWTYSGKPQRPNEPTIAQLAHPAGNPIGTVGSALDQACNDGSVRSAQARHRNTLAALPLFCPVQFLGGDRLTKYPECPAACCLDCTDDLAGHVDPTGRQHAVAVLCNNPHHMADFKVGGRPRLPINLYRHVRRIGHMQAVDDDAAEPTDRAHDARAADAAIIIRISCNHSSTTNATVPFVLAARYLQRHKQQHQRGQPADGRSCNSSGAVPHVPGSSSL